MRRHYIVSYDISDPARLRRVHRTVRDFGDALQLSVFACRLSPRDLAALDARLRKTINTHEDQIILIDLGPCHRASSGLPGSRVLGRPLTTPSPDTVVL